MQGNALNDTLTIAAELLSLLNIENWQLSQGSYNGVALTFYTGSTQQLSVNVDKIPFSGAYTAAKSFIGTQNIPFGTSGGMYRIRDTIKRRLVIHDIPGRNGNYFEDQGWEGETFTVQAIFFGIGYQVLYQQALNYMLNDAMVSTQNRNILVHPVRGTIENCLLTDYSIDNSSAKGMACILNLTFKADNVPYTEAFPISPFTKIYEEIAAVQQIVQEIAGAVSLLSTLFTGNGNFDATPGSLRSGPLVASANGDMSNLNPLIRSQLDLLNTANQRISNLLLYCAKLLYTYMKPASFSDFYLDPVVIDYSQLPELFRFVTIFTSTEIGILLQFYEDQVSETIAEYRTYDLNRVFPDKIQQLQISIVQLAQFAEVLLVLQQENTTTYVVPYDMSLREACFLNNIDFNLDLTPILVNNRQVIGSTNLILKGTQLKLRQLTQ